MTKNLYPIFVLFLLSIPTLVLAELNKDLFQAVKSGDKAKVELLLKQGAEVNVKNHLGDYPLHYSTGKINSDIAEIFHDPLGLKLRFFSFKMNKSYMDNKNRLEISKFLIQHSADVNSRDENGLTPLHYSCWQGDVEITKLLIKHLAKINARALCGVTPIHLACIMNNIKIVVLLIEQSADLNAELTGQSYKGIRPLDIANNNFNDELVGLLNKHGAKRTYEGINKDLIEAVIDQEIPKIKKAVQNGADINVRYYNQNFMGYSPLHPDCVETFIF